MAKRERQECEDVLDRFDSVANLLDLYSEHQLHLQPDGSAQCSLCAISIDNPDFHSQEWSAELKRVERAIIGHVNSDCHVKALDPNADEGCAILLSGVPVTVSSYLLDVVSIAGPGRTLFDYTMKALLVPDGFGRVRILAFHIYIIVELESPKSASRPANRGPRQRHALYKSPLFERHYGSRSYSDNINYLDTYPLRYPTESDLYQFNFNRHVVAPLTSAETEEKAETPQGSQDREEMAANPPPTTKERRIEYGYWLRLKSAIKKRSASRKESKDFENKQPARRKKRATEKTEPHELFQIPSSTPEA